jgi:D-alanyl-D-alanine carboxypeptidase
VVLNGGEDYFQDCATLLDYGLTSFTRVVYARAGEELFRTEVGNLPEDEVSGGAPNDLVKVVRLDRLREAVTGTMEYRGWVDYPVESGQALGTLTVNPDGTPVELPLEAREGAESPGLGERAWAFIASVFAAAGRLLGYLVPGAMTAAGVLRWT